MLEVNRYFWVWKKEHICIQCFFSSSVIWICLTDDVKDQKSPTPGRINLILIIRLLVPDPQDHGQWFPETTKDHTYWDDGMGNQSTKILIDYWTVNMLKMYWECGKLLMQLERDVLWCRRGVFNTRVKTETRSVYVCNVMDRNEVWVIRLYLRSFKKF